MKSLALYDLDIEELDRRIELASPTDGEWGCHAECTAFCRTKVALQS